MTKHIKPGKEKEAVEDNEEVVIPRSCPRCGKPLAVYRKNMPDYLLEKQYGCEIRVCHNMKCSLGMGRVSMKESWTPIEKIKQKVDPKKRREQIDVALFAKSEGWRKENFPEE